MLKKFFSIAAVAMLFAACEIVEVEVEPIIGQSSGVYTIGATFEDSLTKSDVSDKGVFTWSTNDGIWVYSDDGSNTWNPFEFNGYTTGDHNKASFICVTFVGDYMNTAAVFPKVYEKSGNVVIKSNEPSFTGSTLNVKLPGEIQWEDATTNNYEEVNYITMQADNIMVAFFEYPDTENLVFRNVGGMFRLKLKNMPEGATQLVFYTVDNKRISGSFPVNTSGEYPIIETSVIESNATGDELNENKVVINFSEVEGSNTNMVFFIPVPVGSYQIGFDVKDSDGESLWTYTSSTENSVARKQMKKMPVLTYNAETSGSGEGTKSNTRVSPKSPEEDCTVNLPDTEDDVFVRMNKTTHTLNIAYSENAAHPANVYLTALDDIAELNINLPDSHVELSGDGNKMETIDQINANTAVNTLVVFGNVQIGKSGTNDGLKVTGGSLELNAPVAGTVTVDIPAANTNASEEEKVNVEINSAITNLVVTRAANKEEPNKVWVSINNGASVTSTITVPESNCNLYIANGASATTVITSAEENTISGTVGTLSASTSTQTGAETPTVTVTSDATVSTSISATGGADIYIEGGAKTTNANKSTDEGQGSSITTFGNTDVARIGSTGYTTLAAAITAAVAGDEIVILKNMTVTEGYNITKNLTINLSGKTITVNAASDNDSNFNTNRLFFVQGASVDDKVDFTLKNGTTVLDSHIWGSVRFNSHGELTLIDYTSSNCRKNGANIKMTYGHATFNNVVINSKEGGCVDIGDGSYSAPSGAVAEMTNCTFNQTDYYDYVSAAVIVSCSGHVTLNSGTYSGYYALFPHSSGGTITVKDGCTVTGNHNAVHTVSKDLSNYSMMEDHYIYIQGGTINGTFDVGTDGHTTFSITGGTFNNDPTAYVAPGYAATQSGNVWTVGPTGVAMIGTEVYSTLAEAFAAVPATGDATTITVLSDIALTSGVTVPANKNVILELAGHTISEVLSQSGTSALITNNGTLTIQDNTDIQANGRGKGKITYNNGNPDQQSVPGYASNTIINQGNLTINSGYIENKTTGGYAAYTVDNLTNDGLYTPVLTMNGGKLYNSYTDAIRMYLNSTSNLNKVVINGGILDSDKASGRVVVMHLPSGSATHAAKGELKITGGTILGKVNAWSNANAGATDRFGDAQYENVKITISGGAIDELDFSSMANETLRATSLTVTGGTYKVDPSAYVSAGYEAVENNGVWNVVELEIVAQIGNVRYTSLVDAIAAVPTDGTKTTIKMIANETMANNTVILISATKNIVLDLNGKTITSTGGTTKESYYFIQNRGTLEITDSSSSKNGKITTSCADPDTGYSKEYVTVYNIGGTLNLTAGIVETTGTCASYAINNTSNAWGQGDNKETVFNMTGGTINSPAGDAGLRVYQNCADTTTPYSHNYVTISGGTIATGGIFLDNYIYNPHGNTTGSGIITNVTITGGEIHGLIDMKLRHAFHTSISISGGTFVGSKLRVRKVNNSDTDKWQDIIPLPSAPIFTISGGDFTFADYAFALNYLHNGTDWGTYMPYSVTGGTYSSDPSAYVAAGYEATHSGNVWTVAPANVAAIGSTPYTSLAEAFAAATDGQTITLASDVNLAERLFVNAGANPAFGGNNNRYATTTESKSVTLDLNGHNITSSVNIALAGGTLNIVNNGTADAAHGVISTTNGGLAPVEIYGTGDLTAKRTLNIGERVTLSAPEYGLNIFGSNNIISPSPINNIDVNVYGTVKGILFVIGNLTNSANEVNVVVNGTVDASESTVNDSAPINGIMVAGYANVTVNNGAVVKGASGIEVRAGALTVNGGTITGTAAAYSSSPNNSGTTTGGAAIAVAQHSTKKAINATFNGGTLAGVKKLVVIDAQNNNLNNVSVTAVEAIKNEAEVPAGFNWVSNGAGAYTLQSSVAQIGSSYYGSLAEAIAAVPTDGTETTIKMIADETMATGTQLSIAKTQSVVLDLNGKTVTGNGGLSGADFKFLTNEGSLEITDSSAGHNGKITGYWTSPNTGWTCQFNTIYNLGGKLKLSAGTVETTSGYLSYAINTSSNAWGQGDDKEAEFNMTGGVITSNGDAGLRVYQNCSASPTPFSHNTVSISGGTIAKGGIFLDSYIYNPTSSTTGSGIEINVTISGGEIHGLIDLKMRHPYNTSVSVTGGTFRNSMFRVRKYVKEWNTNIPEPTTPVFTISGGDIQFASASDAFVVTKTVNENPHNVWDSYSNQYSITGGSFNVDPSTFVAAGYGVTRSGSNYVVAQVKTTWDGSSKADLTDLGNNTYGIYSAAQLAQLAYDVNHNDNNYAGKTVKLMNDINLNSKAWIPIGLGGNSSTTDLGSETGCFLGTFDGQGHTISNLTATHINDDRSFAGLFGIITLTSSKTVTIKDLAVKNITIRSNHMAAGILGRYYGASASSHLVINGCSVNSGNVVSLPFYNSSSNKYESGNQAAGIVGNAYGKGITITNCAASDLYIYAARDIAGIAGNLESTGVSAFSNNSVADINIIRLITEGYEKEEGSSSLNTLGQIVGRGGYTPDSTNTYQNVSFPKPEEYDPSKGFTVGQGGQMYEEEEGEV